jgi:two-component system, LytTR family, response regulator
MKSIPNNFDPLLLRTSKGLSFLDSNCIIRVEAVSNYSRIYFNNGKTMVVAKLLRWFEAQLSTQQFIRVHRTHLVNKNFIRNYFNGQVSKLELSNGEMIEVARRKKTYFLQCLVA